ncbi:hypothetical protein B9Z55_012959 [Caenorhabditis nigoni]|uniref:PAN-3 domain-containing protein n=1 Tax=Caenorhabditis nigoni TaxID=1611254 RepID=A0A2G5TZL3_9PELO|nr:hypothetical protein B9Z55_012959 [Caenorhabditis nigoni]
MKSLLALFLVFDFLTSGTHVMIEVWGKPNSLKNGKNLGNITWNSCMMACHGSEDCIMAHLRSQNCYLFNEVTMSTVNRTKPENMAIVAFKSNVTNEKCFDVEPTTIWGYIFHYKNTSENPKWIYYTISLARNQWNHMYMYNYSCPEGTWAVFRSDSSIACYVQFYSTNGAGDFNYTYSKTGCEKQTGSPPLAGLHYPEDMSYMDNLVEAVKSVSGIDSFYSRIDGIRTTACQKTPTTEECMSVKGFKFIGQPVKNFDHYNWVTNSSSREKSGYDCLVLVADKKKPLRVDVKSCTKNSPLTVQLVFCSKPAFT